MKTHPVFAASTRSLRILAALAGLALAAPAYATFHFMQIEQVIGGVNGDTTAQAVQLRMRFAGQNLITGAQLVVVDAAGNNPVTLITFPSNVTGGAGRRILIATAALSNYESTPIPADFTMTNPIPASYLAAGRLRYEKAGLVYWSVSWGGPSYTGPNTGTMDNDADGNFAPPFGGALPSTSTSALLFMGATTMSTNNAADYSVTSGAATFTNNADASTVLTAPTQPASKLANISTRLRVLTDPNALIGGMIATGTAGKRVIIRAIGPSLTGLGVPGALANPTLELFQGSTLLMSNDDWQNSSQQAEISNTGLAPSNSAESAIIWTLTPNQGYTAIVRGFNSGTGVGLVEVYDLDAAAASKLGNISTRGFVDVEDNVMIAGLIVAPSNGGSLKVLVRALGPTLSDLGVPGALANPTVDLVNSSGTVIRSDDNWQDDAQQSAQIQAAGLAPAHPEEAALVETISPGPYTAIVRGNSGTTGVGLVEVYNIP